MKQLAALAVLLSSTLVSAQTPTPAGGPLTRHYRDGETLSYHMIATNEDWHYTADASGTAKKTANGSYVEEFRWTGMTSDGQPVTLSPATAQFRQTLSLDPNWLPSGSDMSKADPKIWDKMKLARLLPGTSGPEERDKLIHALLG